MSEMLPQSDRLSVRTWLLRSRLTQLGVALALIVVSAATGGTGTGTAAAVGAGVAAVLLAETLMAGIARAWWWGRAGRVRVLSAREHVSLGVSTVLGTASLVALGIGLSRPAQFSLMATWLAALAAVEWVRIVTRHARAMLLLSPSSDAPPGHDVRVRDECDIVAGVRLARDEGKKVRAIGSRNSSAEYRVAPDGDHVLLDLGTYDQLVEIDAEARCVTVQAGMTQGAFTAILEEHGLALPALNGSDMLTVGGTLATGSICGSRFRLSDHVVALTIVTATGEVAVIDRDHEQFGGHLCSLGLLGVVSTITFECEESFVVSGTVRRTDFVELLALGSAASVQASDYLISDWYPFTGEVITRQLHRHPPDVALRSRRPQDGMTPFVSAAGQLLTQFSNVVPNSAAWVVGLFTKFFRPQDVEARWHEIIVVDAAFDLAYHPIDYLEIVLPRTDYQPFMERLDQLYRDHPEHIPYVPVITDWIPHEPVAWIAKNSVDPHADAEMFAAINVAHQRVERRPLDLVFDPVVSLGLEFGARMHWGKHPWMREATDIRASLPPGNFDRFAQLRREWDPEGIFLTGVFADIFD